MTVFPLQAYSYAFFNLFQFFWHFFTFLIIKTIKVMAAAAATLKIRKVNLACNAEWCCTAMIQARGIAGKSLCFSTSTLRMHLPGSHHRSSAYPQHFSPHSCASPYRKQEYQYQKHRSHYRTDRQNSSKVTYFFSHSYFLFRLYLLISPDNTSLAQIVRR